MKPSVNKFSWPLTNTGEELNVKSTESELKRKLRTMKLEENMEDSSLGLRPPYCAYLWKAFKYKFTVPFDVNVTHRFTHDWDLIKDDVTGIPDDNSKLVPESDQK